MRISVIFWPRLFAFLSFPGWSFGSRRNTVWPMSSLAPFPSVPFFRRKEECSLFSLIFGGAKILPSQVVWAFHIGKNPRVLFSPSLTFLASGVGRFCVPEHFDRL